MMKIAIDLSKETKFMVDRIEINKFVKLHNNKNIFFCKTDYIFQDFDIISKLNNDVVLITGNSDYAITDDIIKKIPSNIAAWYAQNALAKSEILHPLPIGLENKLSAERIGHGVGYFDRACEKEKLLDLNYNNLNEPSKFIYANFNINTNSSYRSIVKNHCIHAEHIDWEEPNLSLSEFFNKIMDYKMVVCPIGNGIDTHRLWEVLYSNRIPITIQVGDYKIYDLYKKLPIIILNNFNQLLDYNFLIEEYTKCKTKLFNKNLLYTEYWINSITNIIYDK